MIVVAKGKYGNVSLDEPLLFRIDIAVKKGLARSRASLVRSAVLEYLDKNVQKKLPDDDGFVDDGGAGFIAFDRTKEARSP